MGNEFGCYRNISRKIQYWSCKILFLKAPRPHECLLSTSLCPISLLLCFRILQSQDSSHCLPVVDSSVSDQQQHRPDPAEPTTERITHFLLSLGQLEPTHTEHTEREGHAPEHKTLDTLSHPDVRSQRGRHQNSHLDQSKCLDEVQSCGWRESQCASVLSDWSARSGSTFDTRDEAAFRDGLAALDASIASLQKTIQLDLGRWYTLSFYICMKYVVMHAYPLLDSAIFYDFNKWYFRLEIKPFKFISLVVMAVLLSHWTYSIITDLFFFMKLQNMF